jgi:hypothetical protein
MKNHLNLEGSITILLRVLSDFFSVIFLKLSNQLQAKNLPVVNHLDRILLIEQHQKASINWTLETKKIQTKPTILQIELK